MAFLPFWSLSDKDKMKENVKHSSNTLVWNDRRVNDSFLHARAVPECRTLCCSFPSGSWSRKWPLVRVSPLYPDHLYLLIDPGEDPANHSEPHVGITWTSNFWRTSLNIYSEHYLGSSGGRTRHVPLRMLLQALDVNAVHHASQNRFCLQLRKHSRVIKLTLEHFHELISLWRGFKTTCAA